MTGEKVQVGRLAMRVEGDDWVAYYAQAQTMEGAIELGRIKMAIVQDQERKQAFMRLFSDFIADVLEAEHGVRPDMPVRPAPEHERSGRA